MILRFGMGDHQKPGAISGEEKKSRVSLLHRWWKLAGMN
jgi:hypothetical protein